MSNTIQSATNSFSKGIIMDFSPEVSGNESLVNALNATLLTYNGNEMALLNDMGNGRVETARLPEGYVPVGACEFGDIIYVVSYNPLLNRSQIGCFPSPERIIDSDETEQPKSSIIASDFQEFKEILVGGKTKSVLTGELKTSSKAYIVFGEPLNPGDKYIIAAKNLENNIDKITGISEINPKYVKINVVSIEDNGRITYLETDQNKYPIKEGDTEKGNYFLKQDTSSNNDISLNDIDDLRSTISSGYLIFKSKVSGKLALLVELEKISGFNCTYYLEKQGDESSFGNNISGFKYKLRVETSWESESGVNPKGWMLTASDTSMKEEEIHQESVEIDGQMITLDEIEIVSKFHLYDNPTSNTDYSFDYPEVNDGQSIYYYEYSDGNGKEEFIKKSSTSYLENESSEKFYFKIPDSYKNNENTYYYDISKCVYNFQVTPFMPYGLLREYSTNLSIDFSKIYTGAAQISKWKYYISDDYITLILGLEIYPELNYSVPEIGIEFYNHDGFAAAYHITGKESYNGTFTEYIPLNGITKSYKLNDIKVGATEKAEDNSIGILLSNIVYLAKIVVKYGTYDSQGNFNSAGDKVFYRWLWTVPVFNDYYFSVEDYEPLKLNFELGNTITFSPGDNYKESHVDYTPDSLNLSDNQASKEFKCSTVNYLNGDIKVNVYPNINNNYGIFSLNADGVNPGSDSILLTEVGLGKRYIEQEETSVKSLNDTNISLPKLDTTIATENNHFNISGTLNKLLGRENELGAGNELWELSEGDFGGYVLHFDGTLTAPDNNSSSQTLDYSSIDESSEENTTITTTMYTEKVLEDYSSHYTYTPDIVNFSNYQLDIVKESGEYVILKPFIYKKEDLEDYGLLLDNNGIVKIKHTLHYRICHKNNTDTYKFYYRIEDNSGNSVPGGSFTTGQYKYFKLSQFEVESKLDSTDLEKFNQLGKIFIAQWDYSLGDSSELGGNTLSNDKTNYVEGESIYTGSNQSTLCNIGIRSKNGFHLFNDEFDSSTLKFSFPQATKIEYGSNTGNSAKIVKNIIILSEQNIVRTIKISFYDESYLSYTYVRDPNSGVVLYANIPYDALTINGVSINMRGEISNESWSNSEIVTVNGHRFIAGDYPDSITVDVGNYLVSLLSMLYPSQGTMTQGTHPVIRNVFFLEDHTNKYTLEFIGISKFDLPDGFNTTTLLNLGQYSFSDYLTSLKENSNVVTFSEEMLRNVTPVFSSILKTTPLLFNIESVKPDVLYDQTLSSYNIFGNDTAKIGGLLSDLCKVYYANGLNNIPSKIQVPYISNFDTESEILKENQNISSNPTEYDCSYLLKWLDLNSEYDLELNNYKGSQTYSIGVNDDNKIHINLINLSKEDILLDISSKIMAPQ